MKSTPLPIAGNYLSVRQPHAWAITEGIKNTENRFWPTDIRGRIYIHAGKNKTELELGMNNLKMHLVKPLPEEEDLDFEAIIGSVEIVDCVESSRSRWYAPGTFGFVPRNTIALARPIPMKANAKLQRLTADIIRKIKRQG